MRIPPTVSQARDLMPQQQQGRGLRNVVIIGQVGAGKSSLVNMLCPGANAPVSISSYACTTKPRSYTCDLGGGLYCTVHDTPGIPQGGSWSFLKFLSKSPKETVQLRDFLKELKGELHLLIYCMALSGLKKSQEKSYEEFKSFVGTRVPVVVVVTGLDKYGHGRNHWWPKNVRALQKFDEGPGYHACVTTLSNSFEYNGSLEDVKRLIGGKLRGPSSIMDSNTSQRPAQLEDTRRLLRGLSNDTQNGDDMRVEAEPKLRASPLSSHSTTAILYNSISSYDPNFPSDLTSPFQSLEMDEKDHRTNGEIAGNTAASEQTNQETLSSTSDSVQDLTSHIRRTSDYPIASGGFGDIWKCDLVRPNVTVQVAVKTIRTLKGNNDLLIQKKAKTLRRELKVWSNLEHDCILPLWGVANNFGLYPAMIFPWVNNGTLTGFLERQQDRLSCRDKFFLLNDIAAGLQYLHSKSIVHGDLTGSNVLVYDDGRACLADFGLSTMILEFIGPSYLTSSIRGNIRWAAAELFEVPEDDEDEEGKAVSLTTECDIYSFGSITLQVLTCKLPYYYVRRDNVVLAQVIRGIKPTPPKKAEIAPAHLAFIERCWLPRAMRPSIEEVVAFIASERQAPVS